jgi:hypothetical protein
MRLATSLPALLFAAVPACLLSGGVLRPVVAQGLLFELRSPHQNRQEGGAFGNAVAGIPDADGDGVEDLLVGAYREGWNSDTYGAGQAYLFSGATGALLREFISPNPELLGSFGVAVSGVPDADGDGQGDLLVGASLEDPYPSPIYAGRAYLFSGATGALLYTLTSPNEDLVGQFGDDVAGVPDVDGDGRGDLLVGAPEEDPGADPNENYGRAYLFSGATGALLRTLAAPTDVTDGYFGSAVAGLPDLNGDHRGDLVVGGFIVRDDLAGRFHLVGRAYVMSGATGVLLHTLAPPGNPPVSSFGVAVSGVPDADGDGLSDLLIGAFNEGVDPERDGRAYLFSGGTGRLLHALRSPAPEGQGYFGRSVAGVPDVDGDGHGDLLVGTHEVKAIDGPYGATGDAGRVYLFSGATGEGLATLTSPNAEAWGYFGWAVGGLSDVDGDGRGDLLVGAFGEDPGTNLESVGRAYLFSGANLTTSAEEEPAAASPAAVMPNPSAGRAVIAFELTAPAEVRLRLYSVLGQEVAAVDAGRLATGAQRLGLDLSALPTGVYMWRLTAGERVETGRVTVVR